MSKIIVYLNNCQSDYVNIVGDRIEQSPDGNFIVAFNGEKVVGIFDVSCILAIYVSETNKGGKL